ncbi:MAG: hypothetical protein QOD50_621, partial [Actinomycetota bacterium]|nr:hypothetical protein [Actinomycetota bacterium]
RTDDVSVVVNEYDLLRMYGHGRDSLPKWTVLAC